MLSVFSWVVSEKKRLNTAIHPKTDKRYVAKQDVVVQLEQERQRRMNAEAREMYWRDKFDQEALEMDEQDHDNRDLTIYRTATRRQRLKTKRLIIIIVNNSFEY